MYSIVYIISYCVISAHRWYGSVSCGNIPPAEILEKKHSGMQSCL